MNEESQTVSNAPSGIVRPLYYKHRHKWPVAWRLWCSFERWVFKAWPRNP